MSVIKHYFGRALRETGQALDRFALNWANNQIYQETYSRHRTVMHLYNKHAIIDSTAFVAPNATVVGNVTLGKHVSVWYGAVVRGDNSKITVGAKTNVQDRAVINTVPYSTDVEIKDVSIGDQVTIGHGAILTSCTIGNKCLIGQNSVILEGSEIGNGSMVAGSAVVLPNTKIPSGQLWGGNPAKFMRNITPEELQGLERSADSYGKLGDTHKKEFTD